MQISALRHLKNLTCEDWIRCAINFYKISLHQQDKQQTKQEKQYKDIAKGKTSKEIE